MKILLVSPFSSVSGSAIRFWNIARQFAGRGYTVIYSERSPKGAPAPLLPGISYKSTRVLPNLYLDILVSTISNLLLLLTNLDCSVYYALKPAPNNCIPALIAGILGKRIFLDIDDLDFAYFGPGLKRALSRFFFFLFPRFFPVVTCHTGMLKRFITADMRIPSSRVYFLQQGISDQFLQNEPTPFSQRIPKSVLYMATLGITSDFEDLAPALKEICSRHSDALVHVVGDGVRRGAFEAKTAEAGIAGNVKFLGRIAHEQVPAIVGQNWIGINYMRPSLTNDCRAILKIREYLAMGLHIVCNDVGDAREFRPYVHIEKDCLDIGRRVCALLDTPIEMNVAGREFVRLSLRWEIIMRDFFSAHNL
jgi:glycosyltransferase involved in cell wall biosynthesis